jgi:PKD repeat protein
MATTVALATLLAFLLAMTAIKLSSQSASISITTSAMNIKNYVRQQVKILGDFVRDGAPVTDALVGVEVRTPMDESLYFRTLEIGNSDERWIVNVTNIAIKDLYGNLITKATPSSTIQISAEVVNAGFQPIQATMTLTVTDENLIPLYSNWAQASLDGSETVIPRWTFQLPASTYPGKCHVFIEVYTDFPRNNGVPYMPESESSFYVVTNSAIEPSYAPPKNTSYTEPGKYEMYLRIPPFSETRPGNYTFYVAGRETWLYKAYGSGSFTVLDAPCPPQAAFTYYPLDSLANMSVAFDASSSSAEGYDDVITRYEWTFDDPYHPEHIVNQGSYSNPPSPLASHAFGYAGTYNVELNVTDNEGLWSYTMKPITILPEYGPTASFTWIPISQLAGEPVSFNASDTQLGWCANTQRFSPIQTYQWNFSDGSPIINVTTPETSYEFTQAGNYSVSLTVIDADGRQDTISHLIQVRNQTAHPWDVDGSGRVDMIDMWIVQKHYGTIPSDPNWDLRADVDGSGRVDMIDMWIVQKHYGETYP